MMSSLSEKRSGQALEAVLQVSLLFAVGYNQACLPTKDKDAFPSRMSSAMTQTQSVSSNELYLLSISLTLTHEVRSLLMFMG